MIAIQEELLETESAKLAPFLKWLGCKTWLAPKLSEMFEPYKHTHTWMEPFCGALGATFGVKPQYAVLNDVNYDLINLYRQVKDNFNGFGIDSNLQYCTSEASYYRLRDRFRMLVSMPPYGEVLAERAELFYYLNRVGYRGLCRNSDKSGFNTPYGHYKKPILNHDFSQYQKAFGPWQFSNFGYEDFINAFPKELQPYCFLYVDPPYDDGFVNYSGAFTWDDQIKLAEMLAALNSPVVASNKATDRIVALYSTLGFELRFIDVRRRISCNGDRSPATEILATKNI